VLRTNLSTRPFYNERGIHVVLTLAGLLVVALTVFNAVRIVSLSRQNTEFSTRINRDRAEAERLTAEATTIRAGINQEELRATLDAASDANRLIEQRTFSWSEFFNRIEETLPADVMLTAVQPSFDQQVPEVLMTVLGRRTEDIDEFIEKLEATQAFSGVLLRQSDPTEEGLQRVMLRAVYTATGSAAASPAAEPVRSSADAQPGAAPQPLSTQASEPAKPGSGGGRR
jgi:hypothetical protein